MAAVKFPDIVNVGERLKNWLTTHAPTLLELGLIGAWALWVGRAYLDMNPDVWPVGGEFPLTIQPHYVWGLLRECGACMFWNGALNGGLPAFVELHAPVLHPLVIVTTLLWGVINGAKVTLVVSLALAGWAQWWLAKVLRLGLAPRLWTALLAVAGGHLAGRMELGLNAMVLSIACVSLVIPPALELALTGQRRSTILFGVTLGLALLAGQGYAQMGLILGFFPALLVLVMNDDFRLRAVWKEFALGTGIALLLAGILIVPWLHFSPNFAKYLDTSFSGGQPYEYLPLNLVISDVSFFHNASLEKILAPVVYLSYIGWLPILLACMAFYGTPATARRRLAFFASAIAWLYFIGSGTALQLLAQVFPNTAAGIRYPPLMALVAVPLILGLAGWGLELAIQQNWPRLTLSWTLKTQVSVNLAWVALPLVLGLGLKSAYDFSKPWYTTATQPPILRHIAAALQTPTTEWVRGPYGEHFWTLPLLDQGAKITQIFRPAYWAQKEVPLIYREATNEVVDPNNPNFIQKLDSFSILDHPENEYAYIDTGAEKIPCAATAHGGDIDVTCNAPVAGQLIVTENMWSGWSVKRDGTRAQLGAGAWLTTDAPAGEHHYAFRYRPWDVAVGLLLTLLGVGVVVFLWWRGDKPITSNPP